MSVYIECPTGDKYQGEGLQILVVVGVRSVRLSHNGRDDDDDDDDDEERERAAEKPSHRYFEI